MSDRGSVHGRLYRFYYTDVHCPVPAARWPAVSDSAMVIRFSSAFVRLHGSVQTVGSCEQPAPERIWRLCYGAAGATGDRQPSTSPSQVTPSSQRTVSRSRITRLPQSAGVAALHACVTDDGWQIWLQVTRPKGHYFDRNVVVQIPKFDSNPNPSPNPILFGQMTLRTSELLPRGLPLWLF